MGGSEAISLLDALSITDFLPHANLDVLAKEDVASYHHHRQNIKEVSQSHGACKWFRIFWPRISFFL